MAGLEVSTNSEGLWNLDDLREQLVVDEAAVVAAQERVERSGNFFTRGVARASLFHKELRWADTRGKLEFSETALS